MSVVHIVVYLLCIALSWWSLQQLKFEVFLRHPISKQAKLLHILSSIALGYLVGSFLIQYLGLSLNLNQLFLNFEE